LHADSHVGLDGVRNNLGHEMKRPRYAYSRPNADGLIENLSSNAVANAKDATFGIFATTQMRHHLSARHADSDQPECIVIFINLIA
jgi:hypothetical protein